MHTGSERHRGRRRRCLAYPGIPDRNRQGCEHVLMSDATYPQDQPADATSSDSVVLPPSERAPLKAVVFALVRALVSFLIVVWIYVNWDPHFGSSSALIFMSVGILLFVIWTAWQGRRIIHAPYPGLRAVEVLATVIPFFLIIFAGTYYSYSVENHAAFNEVLNKGSSMYFTIVVLSTTGFGDIVPKSGWARGTVNAQMLIDLFFVALVLKFILGSVNKGREMRAQGVPPKNVARPRRRKESVANDE